MARRVTRCGTINLKVRTMKLNRREAELLQTFVSLANKLLAGSGEASANTVSSDKRKRRSRDEAAKVKEAIIEARAKGVAVKKLSEKYSVTPAYIYQVTGPSQR